MNKLLDAHQADPGADGGLTAPGHRSLSTESRWCAGAVLVVLALYALLQNGYYVPNSDAEYYISVARNLLLGRGYQYNGEPVGLVPPGWPLVLAGAIWVSNSFTVLNGFVALMMVATAGLWFRALLRLTTPPRAFVVVVLSATLFWGYHSAILLQSEALFCLLLALGVLLALQVAEGKPAGWRVVVLLLLCAGLVTVRWAGLLVWVVMAAALVSRHARPPRRVQWVGVFLLAVVAVGSFAGVRYLLAQWGAGAAAAAPAEVVPLNGERKSVLLEDKVVVPNVDTQKLSRNFYTLMSDGAPWIYFERLGGAGVWMGILYWMPAKMAVASPSVAMAVNVLGWVLLVLFGTYLVVELRRGQWVWIGVLAYGGLLAMRWSSANERYLLPVAPFLLLGPWLALEWLAGRASPWARRPLHVLAIALIASVALCNAFLFAVDAYMARSPNYYAVHHAGRTQPLIDAAAYLAERSLADHEMAVSPLYININRPVQNSYAVRVMNVLTDRIILTVPREVCEGAPDARLIEWAQRKGVRYYLYRPPDLPWRVWHFRAPWLQEKLTGQPVIGSNPFWELYELTPDRAILIHPPVQPTGPRRLPGVGR